VQGDSLEELAAALNDLGVQPDHLVQLVTRVNEGDEEDGEVTEGYEALVWVG
jgi:hypothetical protein